MDGRPVATAPGTDTLGAAQSGLIAPLRSTQRHTALKHAMSIADRVMESINKYVANDLDNALIQVCIALDGTSKKEYPEMKKVGERFQAFVKDNQDIITFFTFNTNIFINFSFGGYTIEQFIYKVLRCGLLHEGEVPEILKFTEPGADITISDKQWCIPKTFIFGTLLAIIGASSNANQVLSNDISVNIMGQNFDVNNLWGHADRIRQAMKPPAA